MPTAGKEMEMILSVTYIKSKQTPSLVGVFGAAAEDDDDDAANAPPPPRRRSMEGGQEVL